MKQPKSITVFGRTWWCRPNGWTAFSASILVDGAPVHRIPFDTGSGDHYVHAAFEWLEENGYIAPRVRHASGGREVPWRYCEDRGIKLHYEAAVVGRRKDL